MTASHKRAVSSRARIDRYLPHQVALPADMCTQENYQTLEKFCADLEDYATRQVQAVWPDGEERAYRLYCFATREAAEAFAAHFEGMHFNPKKDRENGSATGAWRRTDSSAMPECCGPLVMPKFFRWHP